MSELLFLYKIHLFIIFNILSHAPLFPKRSLHLWIFIEDRCTHREGKKVSLWEKKSSEPRGKKRLKKLRKIYILSSQDSSCAYNIFFLSSSLHLKLEKEIRKFIFLWEANVFLFFCCFYKAKRCFLIKFKRKMRDSQKVHENRFSLMK